MTAQAEGYRLEELAFIYELGRHYFEMGYFAPAERIFTGLSAVDAGATPARVGLGLVKLENGLYEEAVSQFRVALENESFALQAKIGLCFAFVALREFARAKWILAEIQKNRSAEIDAELPLRNLVRGLEARCYEEDQLPPGLTEG